MSGQHADGEAGVEFLLVTDVTAGEQAFLPPPPFSPARRRAVAAAAVVVLGGGLVARAATSQDSGRPASATHTESTEQILRDRLAKLGSGEIARANIPGLTACLALACNVTSVLPPTFLTAVRERLGTIAPTEQLDVTTGDEARTWYRRLNARVGTKNGDITAIVTVTKSLVSRVTTSTLKLTSTGVTAYVTHPTGDSGYSIQVQVSGPVGWTPPQDAMGRLAADARLVAGG